jgi:hypothetical protein
MGFQFFEDIAMPPKNRFRQVRLYASVFTNNLADREGRPARHAGLRAGLFTKCLKAA